MKESAKKHKAREATSGAFNMSKERRVPMSKSRAMARRSSGSFIVIAAIVVI